MPACEIDIVASVFNADQFLEGYFIDLTSQTFWSRSRLTLVAPNPSNKLKRVVDIYSALYPSRINLISLRDDPGISSCVNIAIQAGDAPYITFANTDDRKRRDSLERHWIELELNQGIDLVYGYSLLSTKPNETFEINTSNQIYPAYEFDGIRGLLINNSPHNNPMWRRSLNIKNGYLDESIASAADYDLWMRAVSNGSKFQLIYQILGIYYLNPDGRSTNQKYINDNLIEVKKIREKYSSRI